jgi:hypothetical protein
MDQNILFYEPFGTVPNFFDKKNYNFKYLSTLPHIGNNNHPLMDMLMDVKSEIILHI